MKTMIDLIEDELNDIFEKIECDSIDADYENKNDNVNPYWFNQAYKTAITSKRIHHMWTIKCIGVGDNCILSGYY